MSPEIHNTYIRPHKIHNNGHLFTATHMLLHGGANYVVTALVLLFIDRLSREYRLSNIIQSLYQKAMYVGTVDYST